MSTSLSIEFDPVDQPAATDPLDRHSWCALRIRVSGRTVTRIWDRALQEERSFLYVPAFPLAEWFVSNWWALLTETCRSEHLPTHNSASSHLPWIKRHCLRSAESGLLLPAMYLYNDGSCVRIDWQSDERGTQLHMPGEFVDSGSERIENSDVQASLSRFISDVLARVSNLSDDRVDVLIANWAAIQQADTEEINYCVALGRMGLDPYDPETLGDELASFVETHFDTVDRPWIKDLTEVTSPDSIAHQWSWIQAVQEDLHLGAFFGHPADTESQSDGRPARLGYSRAHFVRKRAGLAAFAPVASVEDLAMPVVGTCFKHYTRNHVPGRGVLGIAGASPDGELVFVGPEPSRAESRRFRVARGLYHALFTTDASERLITDAYTWDQQASRAFAAELLAPQHALAAEAGEKPDGGRVELLAERFQTSTVLIERQLENAGISVSEE